MRKVTYFLFWFLLMLVLILIFCQSVLAGGLNRSAATGPTDIGNGSDPNKPWFPYNLGSKIQLRNPNKLEVGVEVMMPKFTYKDWRGREFKSTKVAHVLPYFSYSERIDQDTVWGVDISTEAGNGASFKNIVYGLDSETLVSGTYLKPYYSKRLTDCLSVGFGPVLVVGMETWTGPLDINRVPVPIRADLEAIGLGVGFQFGAMYQLTDRLSVGANYMSSVKVDLKGDCRIDFGLIRLRDNVKSEFQFPDRWDFSVGYEPADGWLLVSQFSYWGYSKNSLRQETVIFDKLPITKSVKLNWEDNYAIYGGLSHAFGLWTIGVGGGYMSKAIDQTTDFMTPDITGFSMAGRIKYSTDDFDLTAAISRGWGENRSHGKEITVDVWTFAVSGSFRF